MKARGGKAREKLRYVRGDSFVHRLDPRTKIAVLLAFTSVAVVVYEAGAMALAFSSLLVLAALSGAFRHWRSVVWGSLPLIAVVVLFSIMFPRVTYGPVLLAADLWLLHPRVTPGGILYSASVGLRLLTVVGASALFIMTTRFEDFVAGLRKLRVPYIFAFSLGLALRSITLMSADMRAITDAQRSRCLELDAGGLVRNANRLLALAVPMIICLISRSRNISSAMMCRGYGSVRRPTLYSSLKIGPADLATLAVVLALVVVVLFFKMPW
jgi:energy-coupling factor transport system permease protein